MLLTACLLLTCGPADTEGGPIAWAACQTACNAAWVTCMTAAGLTAGVAVPPALIAAAAACSSAQGACMTLCTPLLVAPTP